MKPLNQLPADRELGHGVQAYSTLLQRAGGEQLKAMMRTADDRAVCTALYAAPPYDLHVPPMDVARLSLNLTPARVIGGVEGERARSYDAQRYSLFLAPAGAEMHWRKHAASRHMTVYFRPAAMVAGDEADLPLAQSRAIHNLIVPGLRPIADQLALELRQGDFYNADAADCLARLLLIQVSRHLRKSRDDPKALGPTSLQRLKDYVMAHLGERILVADLACQVGMSVDRFAWSFKTQTGQSPHQYILAQRVQRASQLLRHSVLSIADVAHACGFSSQQHLTNAMHRHAGITPARYRQATQPK
jgi:AraC family transcriptional regulator